MLRAFMAGMPARAPKRMFKGASGTSHGEVSRLWQKEGERCIEELRGRDLSQADYVVLVLMLDGMGLGHDLCAVVVRGITADGEKQILDVQMGASETRGFKPIRRLLAVTSGAEGDSEERAGGPHSALPDS